MATLQSYLDRIRQSVSSTPLKPAPIEPTSIRSVEDLIKVVQSYARHAFHGPMFQSNPLNVVLALIAAYLFLSLFRPHSIRRLTPTLAQARSARWNASGAYSFLPTDHPTSVVWKRYTPRTLAVHDGSGLAGRKGGGGGGGATANGTAGTRSASNGGGSAAEKAAVRGDAAARILLAIDGRVFDVTKGANFYGPGGPYGNFAGRDASRGMAKQSFDLDMLTPLDKPLDTLQDLTAMERKNMQEWVAHFTAKYTIVGELVNEGEQGEQEDR